MHLYSQRLFRRQVPALCLLVLLVGAARATAPPRPAEPTLRLTTVAVSTVRNLPVPFMPSVIWRTPAGVRWELSEGNAFFSLKGGSAAYVLDAHKKQAVTLNGTPLQHAADYFHALLSAHFDNPQRPTKQRADRFETHLGRRCRIAYRSGVYQKRPVEAQVWTTQVAGRPLLVRAEIQFPQGEYILYEVTSLRVYEQAPRGLMDIPAGYSVVAPSKETLAFIKKTALPPGAMPAANGG